MEVSCQLLRQCQVTSKVVAPTFYLRTLLCCTFSYHQPRCIVQELFQFASLITGDGKPCLCVPRSLVLLLCRLLFLILPFSVGLCVCLFGTGAVSWYIPGHSSLPGYQLYLIQFVLIFLA